MESMNDKQIAGFSELIRQAYECRCFEDFLRLAITGLHKLVMYDSGLFFCAISRDSSFFQPYISGNLNDYYKKSPFPEREEYLERSDTAGREAVVYKAADFKHGIIVIPDEPRSEFLSAQEQYHIACMRILYRGQFLGEIYLHRNKDKPDFDEQELFLLRLLQPHVSNVFHIIHTLTAVNMLETDKKGLDRKGLCLFDSETNLIAGNMAGLEILNNSTVFGSSVLYHIREIMEDLQAEQQQSKAETAYRFEILKTSGSRLMADIFLNKKSRNKENNRFYVVLEFADDKQSTAEYRFKFTKREADIIDGVLQGKSNLQIASALNLSGNTVKTHLQKIFHKTGVSTRTELVYILMLNQEK
jgi:DNA-binding CsgD family transcriptional regulator